MYIGAASGAVTIGLAVFLVLMSQKPEATKADQPEPQTPAKEIKDTPSPSAQSAVRLPPPPAPAPAVSVNENTSTAEPAASPSRPPLKPRAEPPVPAAPQIEPLKPRPARKPVPADKPLEPLQPSPPLTAALPQDKTAKPVPQKNIAAQPVSPKAAVEGRALLKMLETGKGPVIEIAWPANPGDRSRLYRLLTACHGMQTAMLVDRSKIFSADGPPGSDWRVNRDAVSGFVRRPAGVLTEAERAVIRRIKTHHGMHFGTPVRLFPRTVDATLLGGIGQIVGPGYLKYKTIRARYRLSGNRIAIVDIQADQEKRPGGITLPRSRRCS